MDCPIYKKACKLLLDLEHTQSVNILGHIKHVTEIWCNSRNIASDCITKKELKKLVESFQNELPENSRSDDVFQAIETLVFYETYDYIIPQLKNTHTEVDEYLSKKCAFFYNENISPAHFGGNNDLIGPFTAAVVELSMIDRFRSPKGKLNCLSTTYDLLFAELKAVLVTVISKYSSNETDIPIVNNNEIIPVLMVVIVKSKLTHFYSNLEYIKWYIEDFGEETNIDVFVAFQEAVVKLLRCPLEAPIETKCDKFFKDLGLQEIMELTAENDVRCDTGDDDYYLKDYVEKHEILLEETTAAKSVVLQEQNNYILNLITSAENTT